MTDSKALARPPQVTMAAWVTMVGSFFVIIYAFGMVANLRSIETRERVQDTITAPPASWFGLDVEGYLDVLHAASLVTAACAVATGILGWYVLTRHRPARTALSIIAVPLLVAGAFTDGFMSAMVSFSVILLWLKPARDWFDGLAPTPAPTTAPAATAVQPGQPGPPPHATPYGVRPAFSNARPAEVVQACVVTWVFCSVVLAGSVLAVVTILLVPDAFRDAWERTPEAADAGLAFSTLKRVALATMATTGVWSLAAIVVAGFAFAGRNWARVALIVSAGTAAVFSLLAVTASFVMLLPMAASGLVVALLVRPHVTAWFTRRL